MSGSVGLTGARGILGRRIADALVRSNTSVSAFPGDVRDRGQVGEWVRGGEFATVIHSAALVPVAAVESDPGTAVSVNIGGTANIAASCAEAHKRLIYLSTAHVYAPSPTPLSEFSEVGPKTLYGLTKLQGEEWCRALAPDTLVLRVFSYFDDRQSGEFLVPSLFSRIATAEPDASIAVRGLTSRRDLASAKWLASLVAILSLSGASGIVNCGTGIGWTVSQVTEVLKSALGREDVAAVAADDTQPTALVAEVARLRLLVPDLAPFDLTQSLTEYAHRRDK